ncbi:MAG: YciI family protein [Gammaproteobacteria bacterium]|nr:YciI family protein [Gammaproteobacteria bacterium]
MYVLIVDYIKPTDSVTPHIGAHSEWVKKYVDQGIFLFAGPKKSKLGGVILAKSIDKKALMTMISEDPYVIEDVAEYRVVDFDARLTTGELELLKSL